MKRYVLLSSALLTSIVVLSACSKVESPPTLNDVEAEADGVASTAVTEPSGAEPAVVEETAVTLDARVELPDGWTSEAISPGECMTPIDLMNDGPVSAAPYPAGQAASVVGWNITSSKTDATPEVVYGVFKPYDQSQLGSLLSGNRVERPDVAGGNALYRMAGYELSGQFPTAPGRYRFYLWTGTPNAVVECDSKIVVTIE